MKLFDVWLTPLVIRSDTIEELAESRFLLAEAQMNFVLSKYAPRTMQKALDSLPKDLDSGYIRAVQRIRSDDDPAVTKQAFMTLCWIFHAPRPLQMDELRELIVIEPEDEDVHSWTLPDDSSILEPCRGLVAYEPESKVVRLAHYTVQNYVK